MTDYKPAPAVAYFSSRGPSYISPNILKARLFWLLPLVIPSSAISLLVCAAWYRSTWCEHSCIVDWQRYGRYPRRQRAFAFQCDFRDFHGMSPCFWCGCHGQIPTPLVESLSDQISHHDNSNPSKQFEVANNSRLRFGGNALRLWCRRSYNRGAVGAGVGIWNQYYWLLELPLLPWLQHIKA